MKQLLIFFSVLLVFTACTRDANVDLPKAEPMLVINSFIGTDSEVIEVKVTQSVPLNGTPISGFHIDFATVKINGVVIPFVGPTNQYQISASELPIVAGQTYQLEVSAPGFETVTASCTVPNTPPLDFQVSDPVITDNARRFDLTINDDTQTGVENFYALYGRSVYLDFQGNEESKQIRFNDQDNLYRSEFFVENKLVVRNIKAYGYDGSPSDIERIELKLLRTDEGYFRYLTSIENDGENPFGEPTIIYTNINNGLGIFSAYHTLEKIIEL